MAKLQLLLIAAIMVVAGVDGHGRFLKPPNRSSIWRIPEFAHLKPPANYDDNQLYCGAVHQVEIPGNNCGVCGDPFTQAKPRDNEIGGKYDAGIIVAHYTAGQVIDVEVQLTAAHKGFMEWRLCDNPQSETQECFNKNLLQLADGSGSRLPVTETGTYTTKVRLPAGVTCQRCIIQWNYRSGNNPSPAQETFRGCSDVSIS